MNSLVPTIDMTLPIGSLDTYIQKVNLFPLLTAEQEYELAKRFTEQNDLQAARELVLAHLRYVVRIARGYAGYGLPQADLIQEGNIGLMKAVRRFNPEIGVRLVSFAIHWIKAEMHEFIIKNWRLVKIATTKAQRKLFFNLRSLKNSLNWLNQEEITTIAQDLGVSEKDVTEMEQRLKAHYASFDGEDNENDSGHSSSTNSLAPLHYLAAENADPAQLLEQQDHDHQTLEHLQNALGSLDARSQNILKRRWLASEKATLHELAAEYKVSPERIRQLENNAMKKIKQQLINSKTALA